MGAKKEPQVIIVTCEPDEDKTTVVGPFGNRAECVDWMSAAGSFILTQGLHQAVAHGYVAPPDVHAMLYPRCQDNHPGVLKPPTRDDIMTVVLVKVGFRDEDGVTYSRIPVGPFVSTQDAENWVEGMTWGHGDFENTALVRQLLEPEQFVAEVDKWRIGQMDWTKQG